MGEQRDITFRALRELKQRGEKFCMLTCYDAATARLMSSAGVDTLLVGDTAGEVVLGYESTHAVRPEFLIELTAGVRRGAPRSFILGDLPLLCRQGDIAGTVEWAKRFIADGGCDGVKIEVTGAEVDVIRTCVEAGVPTVAHLGLLPQRVQPSEGYRAQGRDVAGALKLIEAARQCEAAGADGLLLEAVASEVAREITRHTPLPVIGCASGPDCDGTVVVLHDMLNWGGGHPPRAVRQYTDIGEDMAAAFRAYAEDVRSGRFPAEQHTIHMKPDELNELLSQTGQP